MERLIYFRGRDINTGEVIFGDLRHIGIRTYIFKEAQCYYDEELIEVDEDSIAQLVGYDADGNEVYEGDELVDDDGCEWKAGILATAASTIHKGVSHDINTLKLKGNAK